MTIGRAGLHMLIVGILPGPLPADEELGRRAAIDYSREIKPVLSKHCYACHGALKQKAGLRLDTAAFIKEGGDSGSAIEPGSSAESLIVDAVTGSDGWQMPPENEGSPLSADEIARLKAWIDQGAKSPPDELPQPDPRRHWSFQKPVRPAVPSAATLGESARWVRNPIDAFLASEHQKHGLKPRPAADPATLIRRVYLDLTGLVPSPDVVRAFVADPGDRTYEAIVDRLLASPEFGERAGRHWMDVWRYSDWDGFGAEVRESQPHIWRWRDWIVESLNRDLPYDRMIVSMLAADETDPCDTASLRATGFLARNWYKFNRNVWLEDTVEHTAKAFLGLTLNCAKCHDHKFDPIAQTDYYAFRAFFEPYTVRTDPVPGEPDTTKGGLVRVYDEQAATPTFVFERGDEKRPIKGKPLVPSIPRILGMQARLEPISPLALPAEVYYPGIKGSVREQAIDRALGAITAQKAALAAAERALANARDPAVAEKARQAVALAKKSLKAAQADRAALDARIAADVARYASPPRADAAALTRVAARLDQKRRLLQAEEALLKAEIADLEARTGPKQPGQPKKTPPPDTATPLKNAREAVAAARKSVQEDAATYPPLTPVYPPTSTGRRRALAHWITHRDNPLTARMAINQVWMHHFNAPLVSSVFDFGRNGTAPMIPELLDWLAVELQSGGWKLKPIHRLIVTSACYRMESADAGPDDPNIARDRANVYYWRMNPRRMEAEAVRDNVLQVAGSLDQSIGGPDLDPEFGLKSGRRSLYFRHAKEKRVMFLRLFDSPNVLSCYQRTDSVMPQQALALANSVLCLEQARLLARKLEKGLACQPGQSRDTAFVIAAFERVLGRLPTGDETAACEEYLRSGARQFANLSGLVPFSSGPTAAVGPSVDPAQRAREDLVHVLFNHNDFITIR
jgi:Protein of unknown function (DUF1549)/Protein of unknown function (DUF1553)/Planctomycete cytochrome C